VNGTWPPSASEFPQQLAHRRNSSSAAIHRSSGRAAGLAPHPVGSKRVPSPALKGHTKHGDVVCGEAGTCQTGDPTFCDQTTGACDAAGVCMV
jgi:hypothetical protein